MREEILNFIQKHPYLCVGLVFLAIAAVGVAGATGTPWAALIIMGIGGAVLTGIAHDFG